MPPRKTAKKPIDRHMALELKLYINNDYELHRRQTIPIQQNLLRKQQRGVYKKTKAIDLYQYLADNGARKYSKEFRMRPGDINPRTRRLTAALMAREFDRENPMPKKMSVAKKKKVVRAKVAVAKRKKA